ncbi:UNVERIFIED_CONTAM: hypothetical protein FKN15_006259 [Acipenser sinensis]
MAEISQALTTTPVDVAALRRMAISEGGLLTDEIRCKVWPKLLNIQTDDLPDKPGAALRENNKDYQQVLLDVRRSLRRFPPGMPDDQREGLQEELIDIILQVLLGNPQLHYYQGYHDIVVTFLLVVGEKLATALVEKLSTHHLRYERGFSSSVPLKGVYDTNLSIRTVSSGVPKTHMGNGNLGVPRVAPLVKARPRGVLQSGQSRDFMDPTMDNTKHILNYLMPIIERVNPEVHDFMQRAEVGTIFALSWLITWFGHVLSDFRHVVRLYDFFLACHPLMPIYFAAVIVLYREPEVLECECDMASVHHLLSQIPQDLPYETLISRAGDLFVQFPPSELAREAAQQQSQRTAVSTFKDFELVSAQQRPDTVLRRRFKEQLAKEVESKAVMARPRNSRFVKLAVMGLTVALGAAALAVVNTALQWAPKIDLQLFP